MPPIDFSEMMSDDQESTSCASTAPWKAVWEDREYDVYCSAPRGHLGRHAGNGWTWDNENGRDDYPLTEQELSESQNDDSDSV